LGNWSTPTQGPVYQGFATIGGDELGKKDKETKEANMDQIKRVKRVPHLYERRYQTAAGERRSKYYGIFTCKLKRKRRVFPLGGDLDTAKEALALKLAENVHGKDFDEQENEQRGYTFSEWCDEYFAKRIDPEKHAGGVEREKLSYKMLKTFFGDMLLTEIKRSNIMEYRAKRLQDPVLTHGKPVMLDGKVKTVSFATVNRELAFLRFMLNMAEDDEIIEAAPKFKSKGKNSLIKSEKERKRDRIASEDEYRAILGNMKRPAQRVLIALYETAMRLNEVINLPLTYIDEKAGFIRLPAAYVKEKKKRNVPISAELQAVLNELKSEQKKVSSISGRVFTRNGRPMKSIRTAFEEAKEKAEIEDLHLHDFRHTCITRWAAMGIPQPAIMAAAGHHSIQQNQDYTNMKDTHLKQAFRNSTPVIQDTGLETKRNVSY
jgi:integrase